MNTSVINKQKTLPEMDNNKNRTNNVNININTTPIISNHSSYLIELLKTENGKRLSINPNLLEHGSLLEKAKQCRQPQNGLNIEHKKTDSQFTFLPRLNSSRISNQVEFLEKFAKKINNESNNNKNKLIEEISYNKPEKIEISKNMQIDESPILCNIFKNSPANTPLKNTQITEKTDCTNTYVNPDFSDDFDSRKIVEYETMQDYYSIKNCNIVLEYSFREDINIDAQSVMEDKSKSIENFDNNKYQMLFEIFDGHGGEDISAFLQQNFAKVYKQYLRINRGNIPKSLNNTFSDIDDIIKNSIENNLEGMGSTGTIIHIKWEKKDIMMIYTANIGDTEACLISPMHIIKLSYLHDINDEKEKKRIFGDNEVEDDKLANGNLTRCFGDYELKNENNGIITKPFLSKIKVDLKIKNQFLIIGSKAIWEFIKEDDMQKMILVNRDTEKLCSLIIKKSLDLGAEDNLSVFVIKLT